MKIKVEHEKFTEVAKVAAILGDNGFNFTPEFFLAIVVDHDDTMRVHFQSGAIQADMALPILESSMSRQEGVCVPKNEIIRFLNAANSDIISMEVDGNMAKLRAGKSLMKAVTMDLQGFPLPAPAEASLCSIQVDAQALKAALALTNVGASSDSLGTYLELRDDLLYVYATDGKALTHSAIQASLISGAASMQPVALSMKTAQPLVKALNHFDCGEVQIHFHENNVSFCDTERTWNIHTLKISDPKPIQWERMLKVETVPLCSITDNDAMETCLDISTAISNEKKNIVALNVEDNQLTMTLSNDRGESQSTLEVITQMPYQALTSSLYIYAFLGFCRKYGENGVIQLYKLNTSNANPLRLSYTGEHYFASDPTIVIAPYTP